MPKKSGSKYCHVNAFVVNNKNGQIFKKSFKFKVSERLSDNERWEILLKEFAQKGVKLELKS